MKPFDFSGESLNRAVGRSLFRLPGKEILLFGLRSIRAAFRAEFGLYDSIREGVPVVDAARFKTCQSGGRS